MNRALARDLTAWERGGLPLSELRARHPAAAELTALHGRLAELRSIPAGDPAAGWQRLRARLPTARPQPSIERTIARPRGFRRPLAAAAAAVVLFVGGYTAAPEAVQAKLAAAWDRIASVFDRGTASSSGRPVPPFRPHRLPGAFTVDEGLERGGGPAGADAGEDRDRPAQERGDGDDRETDREGREDREGRDDESDDRDDESDDRDDGSDDREDDPDDLDDLDDRDEDGSVDGDD